MLTIVIYTAVALAVAYYLVWGIWAISTQIYREHKCSPPETYKAWEVALYLFIGSSLVVKGTHAIIRYFN